MRLHSIYTHAECHRANICELEFVRSAICKYGTADSINIAFHHIHQRIWQICLSPRLRRPGRNSIARPAALLLITQVQ